MNNKKIVLIRPKSLHSWEALGIGYLASYSYKFGYKPEQYKFFTAEFDSDEDIIKGCEDADFIGFSLTTFQIKHATELIEQIRKINKKAKIEWGGYAVSGLSEKQLIEMYGAYADYFIQGPGEVAWVEILNGNINERVIRRDLPHNLDEIPFPDRELIRIDRHFDKLKKLGEGTKTSMEMQRGACPYKCIYCAASSYSKPYARTRTAENIVEEMAILKEKYGLDKDSMVLMTDAEVFLTDEMYKMGELKIKNGIDFKFGMNVVASNIIGEEQRKILSKLVEAGLSEVWMGVESDPSLMHLTKKPITPKQVKEAFKITKQMGLIRKAYFILGFTPEETKETILNRIPFIEEINPDVVGFTIYIPVPGCSDYKHEIHKNINYSNSDEYFNDFTKTNTLTNKELKYWQQYLVSYFKDKITYRQKNEVEIQIKDKPGRSGY